MWPFTGDRLVVPGPEECLPGRAVMLPVPEGHFVYGHALAEATREAYQRQLEAAGLDEITTEIREAPPFYFAEDYHQQYLAKNPYGYCGLGGTGVTCPMPAKAAAD